MKSKFTKIHGFLVGLLLAFAGNAANAQAPAQTEFQELNSQLTEIRLKLAGSEAKTNSADYAQLQAQETFLMQKLQDLTPVSGVVNPDAKLTPAMVPTAAPQANDPSWTPTTVSTGNEANDAALIEQWKQNNGINKPE
jgi:ATP-dependent exoDNAse (exonuclease V) beta subunit